MKQSEIIFMRFFWSKKDCKFILCYLNLKSKHADLGKQRGQQNLTCKTTSNAVDSGYPQRKKEKNTCSLTPYNTVFTYILYNYNILIKNVWFKQLLSNGTQCTQMASQFNIN